MGGEPNQTGSAAVPLYDGDGEYNRGSAHDIHDLHQHITATSPYEDFVVVSEFGKDGPTPIVHVPMEYQPPDFDLERFVVATMAVDAQHQSDEDVGTTREDTQVVVPIPRNVMGGPQKPRAQAYVHHLNLHDIAARGYTRQVSFSFISFEPRKVMAYFADLLAEFMAISNLIKVCSLSHGHLS